MMNKGRLEFEKVLDRNLRTKFVKRNINGDIAKFEAEEMLAASPERS